MGAELTISPSSSTCVSAEVNDTFADLSPVLFQFAAPLTTHIIAAFKLTFPAYEIDVPTAIPESLPGAISACFDRLKQSTDSKFKLPTPSATMHLSLICTGVTAVFPHSNDLELPHLPAVPAYLEQRESRRYRSETLKVHELSFIMAKGESIEEFELQIRKINMQEEGNPDGYLEVEWFGITQTSPFKHLDIFGELAVIKWR